MGQGESNGERKRLRREHGSTRRDWVVTQQPTCLRSLGTYRCSMMGKHYQRGTTAAGFRSNVLKVAHQLSCFCHESRSEENLKNKKSAVEPYYTLFSSLSHSSASFPQSLPHKNPPSRPVLHSTPCRPPSPTVSPFLNSRPRRHTHAGPPLLCVTLTD